MEVFPYASLSYWQLVLLPVYPYTSVSFWLLVLNEELDSYRKERCYGQGYGGGGVTGGGYVKSGAHILAKENGNQDVEVDQAKVSSVMLIAVKAACKVGVGRGNAAVGYAKKGKGKNGENGHVCQQSNQQRQTATNK